MKFQLEEYHRNTPVEELINDLKAVSKKLNKNTVTTNEYDTHGRYHSSTLLKRFGSWFVALEKACLKESRTKFNISNEELFENIENVWITLGRTPKYAEMKKPLSKYAATTYDRKFGTWRKALEEFIKYINDDSNEKVENEETEVTEIIPRNTIIHHTRREISERMRFRILMRDGFTCKKCGRSPMKSLGVELHVDHINPWSKGG